MTIRSFLGTTLALSTLACTDVNLSIPVHETSFASRQSVLATVCAPPDLSELPPYKLLFIVDLSYSTTWTDPVPQSGKPRREQAVRDVIARYKTNNNVSYGIITFSDAPYRQTFGYTNDLSNLEGATANLSSSQGGTNYSDTLWSVIDFMHADIAKIGAVEARRTHYLVFWLSDGFPTVGAVDPNALLPGVAYLRDSVKAQAAEFRMDTAFLGGGPVPTTPSDITALDEAKQLLRGMSQTGGGGFIDIPAGQSFTFDVNIKPNVRKFTLQTVVANNRNAQFAPDHPLADSDGDFLSDDSEATEGTDPLSADTDGDGYRDGVEVLQARTLHPAHGDAGCAMPGVDTDHDDLWDCEETLLGTRLDNPDSDGDGLTDGLEVRLGSAPTIASTSIDSDLDGFGDALEVKAHMPASAATSKDDIDHWGYRYITTPVAGDANCYTIDVDNTSMYETLATDTTERGQNTLEVIVSFVPEGTYGPVSFSRALYNGAFLLPDTQSPPGGSMVLEAKDFQAF